MFKQIMKLLSGNKSANPSRSGLADSFTQNILTQYFLINWERELICRPDITMQKVVDDIVDRIANPVYAWSSEELEQEHTDVWCIQMEKYAVDWSRQFFNESQLLEQEFVNTMTDRLYASFEALKELGIWAEGPLGTTIQDGWGYIHTANTKDNYAGAVFFTDQDIFDLVDNHSLLLSFWAFNDDKSETENVGKNAWETLTSFGFDVKWNGESDRRLEISPFPWQPRRFSEYPNLKGANTRPFCGQAELGISAWTDFDWTPFEQETTANYWAGLFEVEFFNSMRNVARHYAGRGQIWHSSEPVIFIRSGELMALRPGDAFLNIPGYDG